MPPELIKMKNETPWRVFAYQWNEDFMPEALVISYVNSSIGLTGLLVFFITNVFHLSRYFLAGLHKTLCAHFRVYQTTVSPQTLRLLNELVIVLVLTVRFSSTITRRRMLQVLSPGRERDSCLYLKEKNAVRPGKLCGPRSIELTP